MSIPLIDLDHFDRAGEAAVARAVGDACARVGFFAITNFAVPQSVLDDAWAAARGFFDLPLDERLAAKVPYAGYPYGYCPFKAETLAYSLGEETPADLKESYSCAFTQAPRGPLADPDEAFAHSPNIWPARPAGFAEAMRGYYEAMSVLAARLMRLFAIALDLPPGHFAPMIDRHVSGLRILNYPEQAVPPEPGQIRAGAHTDYGSLTILRQEAAPGGLQVLGPDGGWLDVPAHPDSLVVNLGDLMQRWTNDRWRSTLHRVVNPPPDAQGRSRRQSIAFFHQPNWDARIDCIPSCL
ncbi:MAG: isopenicillin N synthase family dioxygenase, partial [Alphaproteobacteria bacterium]